MTLRDLLTDIHTLAEELLAFERRYGIRSETFYAAYVSGAEPQDDQWVLDFGEWPASIVPGSLGKPRTAVQDSQRTPPSKGLTHSLGSPSLLGPLSEVLTLSTSVDIPANHALCPLVCSHHDALGLNERKPVYVPEQSDVGDAI